MLPFDLSQYSVTARNDLCMAFYRDLERVMATPEGREYIESKTAERLARQIVNSIKKPPQDQEDPEAE